MKRTLALFLALLMALSLAPATFAASNEATQAAQALYELGLFQGTGSNADGTPTFDLDRTPTRAEAVTMLVRLLGKDAAAKAGTWTTPFTDVDEWAKPYVGYAYANGLTTGTSETTFGGTSTIDATQYLTFVLRALGYTSGTDFQWDKAWERSDAIKLTDGQYNAGTTRFTRGDVAMISESALTVRGKGKNVTMLSELVKAGAVTKQAEQNYLHPPVKAQSVALSKSSLELEIGKSETLTASILPADVTDKTVAWKSSDPSVVTVDNGTLKAIAEGNATVSAATENGKTASCAVSVVKRALSTVPLYEDADVKITFSHVEARRYSDDEFSVYLDVQNKTGSQITVQCDAVNLNGYSFCKTIMSDDVSANSVGQVDVVVEDFTHTPVTLNNIETVGGQFRIIPSGERSHPIQFPARNIYTGETDDTIPEASGKKLLYSDSKLEFYYGYAQPDRYSDDGSEIEVYLLVRNKSAKTYLIQNETVVIDGRSYNRTIMSDPVLPRSAGYVEVSIDDYVGPKPESITTVGGEFQIIDDNGNEKTYTATLGHSGGSSSDDSSSDDSSFGGGSSGSSSSGDSSDDASWSTGKDVNDLVSYISTNGKLSSGYRKIQHSAAANGKQYTATITYRDDSDQLLFHFQYADQVVQFDYDIASQSADSISAYGIGSAGAFCTAPFDMSSYTSSTDLEFTKDFEDSALFPYAENYNEVSNALVRIAIPAFGLLLTNQAEMTLADIGFNSYL